MSMMVSFVLSFFPRDVLDEILNLIESVSEDFPSYSKIKEIIEGDARFTVRDIARNVVISLSTVHLSLKKHLKVRKISAR